MKKIIVYCEKIPHTDKMSDVSYELISKAYKVAQESKSMIENEDFYITAVVLSSEIDKNEIKKAYSAGADKVVLIKSDSFDIFSSYVLANCFFEYYSKNPADVIIFPATTTGRMVAPRVTTMLDTGLVADCVGLEFILRENKLRLAPTRPTFGAELMATILSKKDPQCATIRPNTFVFDLFLDKEGVFEEFSPNSYSETRFKLIRTVMDKTVEKDSFEGAKIVFAAGFGLAEGKNRVYIEKLEKLAKVFDAKVASTRKLVDFNLMPHKNQVGQTGASINADLYIAFGISGAIQHIQGMKNCKTVVAITSDNDATIFSYADYKIQADAKKVLDDLYEHFCK